MSHSNLHEQDRVKSREIEVRIQVDAVKDMYRDAFEENSMLFDLTSSLTRNFTSITPNALLSDTRIIKILRYAVAPTISQMKFGQLFGLNSIDKFEKENLVTGPQIREFEKFAPMICKFVTENLDSSRFSIFSKSLSKNSKEYELVKGWTSSLAADQNSQTAFRNWRKERQEDAIAKELISLGYVQSSYRGVIIKKDDVEPGFYTRELRVQGRTRQKADVIVRRKKDGRLVLIEAKAVGVELDATKRIKECCDKANDWRVSPHLKDPLVVSVIAGFFTPMNIKNLLASNIEVVWEHNLSMLRKCL